MASLLGRAALRSGLTRGSRSSLVAQTPQRSHWSFTGPSIREIKLEDIDLSALHAPVVNFFGVETKMRNLAPDELYNLITIQEPLAPQITISADQPRIATIDDVAPTAEPVPDTIDLSRTYRPHSKRRKRTHGYLARRATKGGRAILKRRRAKGQATMAV